MYKELFMHIRVKQLSVQVRWMPSHLKDGVKVRPSDTTDLDIEGNDKADSLADTAASFLKIPDHAAKKYIKHASLVITIQKRLATILMYLPKRTKIHEEKIPKTKESILEILENTSHTISCIKDRYHCSSCLSTFKMSDPSAKHWLKTSCTRSPAQAEVTIHKPVKISQPIHIGNQTSHSSHEIYKYKGVVYCNKCGCYGVKKLTHLSKKCEAQTAAGKLVLQCIEQDIPPGALVVWPESMLSQDRSAV